MTMRAKKMAVVAAATALAAAGIVWGARSETRSAHAAESPDRAAADTPAGRSVVAPGLVEAKDDVVSLAFEAAGGVESVLVHEGDHVEKGQLLATLDARIARAQLARAEATLAAAEARRDAALRGARPSEIEAARADADALRAQAAERALASERAEKLVTADAIPTAERDTDRNALDAARAQVAASEARWSLLREGTRVESRREAVAAVEVARADVEEARTRLAQTELRAPRAATVLRRLVEPGEQVTTLPPTVVIKIADAHDLRLRAEVDEADIGSVHVGQLGYATAEAYGARRFAGHVVRVEGELGRKRVRDDDPRARVDTRVLEAIFAFDEPEGVPLGLRMDLHLQ
jgi:HlyD family secretion protein